MSPFLAIREGEQGEVGPTQIAKLRILIVDVRVIELVWQVLDVEVFVQVWDVKHGVFSRND